MRKLIPAFALLATVLLVATGIDAQDKKKEAKEVVLKGKICCNKCERNEGTECVTLIVVQDEKKKDILYFFDAAAHGKHHDSICANAKDGTITAIVKEIDKKKVVDVKKLEFAK